jgi:SAM-dependent methyltransferase
MKKPYFLGKPFSGNEKHAFSSPEAIAELRRAFLGGERPNLEYVMRNRFIWMNSYIKPEQKGIEVGCGPGLLKQYINSNNFILTDIEQHPWVEKKVDAINMPFDNSSLDYIISCNMIHHLALPCRFFSECSRVLGKGGKLIIQEVNASFLLRLMMVILNHESYSYDVDVFDGKTICNNPADPWSSNDAVPNMLFDNKEKFESVFPFKIIYDRHAECLIWPLSGGVAGLIKTIRFPKILLKTIDKIDGLLIAISKNTFALQRQIVLENMKGSK